MRLICQVTADPRCPRDCQTGAGASQRKTIKIRARCLLPFDVRRRTCLETFPTGRAIYPCRRHPKRHLHPLSARWARNLETSWLRRSFRGWMGNCIPRFRMLRRRFEFSLPIPQRLRALIRLHFEGPIYASAKLTRKTFRRDIGERLQIVVKDAIGGYGRLLSANTAVHNGSQRVDICPWSHPSTALILFDRGVAMRDNASHRNGVPNRLTRGTKVD